MWSRRAFGSTLAAAACGSGLSAGAGAVNWNKTNWLLTTYAPTAPVITAQPQNQTAAPGNSVTFTDTYRAAPTPQAHKLQDISACEIARWVASRSTSSGRDSA